MRYKTNYVLMWFDGVLFHEKDCEGYDVCQKEKLGFQKRGYAVAHGFEKVVYVFKERVSDDED